ncbi:protein of unknown function [Tenacibaculum sp. 190524A02b]|uniref:Uncharacterized protein n=1 Tax=Tenacibaculum vairaonense TaxID=3137860 RepID=A0ABM9PN03_9FLAO
MLSKNFSLAHNKTLNNYFIFLFYSKENTNPNQILFIKTPQPKFNDNKKYVKFFYSLALSMKNMFFCNSKS